VPDGLGLAQLGGGFVVAGIIAFVAGLTTKWLLNAQKVGQVAFDRAESSLEREVERAHAATARAEARADTAEADAARARAESATAREETALARRELLAERSNHDETKRKLAALARRLRPEDEP